MILQTLDRPGLAARYRNKHHLSKHQPALPLLLYILRGLELEIVRVGEDDRIDRFRIDRRRLQVSQPEIFRALKQSTIDQDPTVIGFQKKF